MKISKIISGIAAVFFAVFCVTFTAFAEPQDYEPSLARAVQTNGAWGQSITFSTNDVNPAGIGPDTTFEVEFELEGEPAIPNQHQVELILQDYAADPQIWAQVVPTEYDDTHAVFDYDAMVLAYGSDDLSTVKNICIGDRGIKMKVTYVKVTNYDPPAPATKATEASTEAVTEASADEAETSATTAASDTSSAPESGGSNTVLVIIIIAVVVVVAAIVVVIIVTKSNKKRFY